MPYSMDSRVRYSEVGRNRRLTLTAMIDYLQDCATFQCEDLGVGVDYMAANRKAWFLTSWNIAIMQYPYLGESIKVQTWATDLGRIQYRRDFRILDSNGETAAAAHSDWVYMDLAAGRPSSMPDEERQLYGHEAPVGIPEAPRHIRLPKDMKPVEHIHVMKSHIDTNNHVNNCQYIRLAIGMAPDGFRVTSLRAEYRRAALLGDTICPRLLVSGDTYSVALEDTDGVTYANIEFKGEFHAQSGREASIDDR